ncbi:MAG TPA: amphi-Trp domain-containing protein [Pyrinomonadaceae bacterium]|jgi:amphi-Trp domain-containing protein
MEEIEIEKGYSNKQTAEKLRRLAESLEQGTAFEIQVKGQRIYVPADAEIDFEYERAENEHELEIEIKWKGK